MPKNIILRVTANTDDADAILDREIARVKGMDGVEGTAKITVDTDQAKKQLDEVIARIKAMPSRESVSIRVTAETGALDRLQARMDKLKLQAANVGAGGDISNSLAQRMGSTQREIDRTVARLRNLETEFHNVEHGGDQAFNKVSQAIVSMVSAIPVVGGVLGSLFSGIASGVANLAGGLLPEATQGFLSIAASAPALAVLGGVILFIAGALAALVISLAQALIGVVALGVAFLAALAPIAALLIAVGIKFAGVISGQNALATATSNLATATDAQKNAVIALQQAQQTQARERLAAINDERAATLGLTDAQNGYKDALLGVQSAKLNADQARLSLAQLNQQLRAFGLSPASLSKRQTGVDVTGPQGQQQVGASKLGWQQLLLQERQAVLAVKIAVQGVADAQAGAHDAANALLLAQQKYDLYLQKGLLAYPAYASAIDATARAMNTLAAANTRVAKANAAVGNAQTNAPTKLLATWQRFKDALSKLFGPAETKVFDGLLHAIDILSTKLGPLVGPLTNLGNALGNGFVQLAQTVTSPQVLSGLSQLINGSAGLIRPLVTAFTNFAKVIGIIVLTTLPTLTQGVKDLGKWFGDVAKHPQKIRDFITQCLSQTKLWLTQIGNVLSTFLSILTTLRDIFNFLKDVASPFIAVYNLGKSFGKTLSGTPGPPATVKTPAQFKAWAAQTQGVGLVQTPRGGQFVDWAAVAKALAAWEAGFPAGSPENPVVKVAPPKIKLPANLHHIVKAAVARAASVGMPPTNASLLSAHTAAAAGGVNHYHAWTLQHGDTIQSDEHFVAVVEQRLAGLGQSYGRA